MYTYNYIYIHTVYNPYYRGLQHEKHGLRPFLGTPISLPRLGGEIVTSMTQQNPPQGYPLVPSGKHTKNYGKIHHF